MLRIVTPAAADPVSLDEAKRHLRVDFDDDNEMILGFISAATRQAQSTTQRLFVTQTVEWVLQGWCGGRVCLPISPVAKNGVNSIKYIDWATHAEQTLDPDLYVVKTDGDTVAIIPAFGCTWPTVFAFSPEPIVINFDVGTAAADVPSNVKSAIKLTVAHLYENRQDVVIDSTRVTAVELPQGALSLLLSETW